MVKDFECLMDYSDNMEDYQYTKYVFRQSGIKQKIMNNIIDKVLKAKGSDSFSLWSAFGKRKCYVIADNNGNILQQFLEYKKGLFVYFNYYSDTHELGRYYIVPLQMSLSAFANSEHQDNIDTNFYKGTPHKVVNILDLIYDKNIPQ